MLAYSTTHTHTYTTTYTNHTYTYCICHAQTLSDELNMLSILVEAKGVKGGDGVSDAQSLMRESEQKSDRGRERGTKKDKNERR